MSRTYFCCSMHACNAPFHILSTFCTYFCTISFLNDECHLPFAQIIMMTTKIFFRKTTKNLRATYLLPSKLITISQK